MNVKRFVGRNARDAMAQVRATWGDDAVVLSNRPIPGGVEILALPGVEDVPTHASAAAATSAAMAAAVPAAPSQRTAPPMSTLSFERFVRERQKRAQEEAASAGPSQVSTASPAAAPVAASEPISIEPVRKAVVTGPSFVDLSLDEPPALDALTQPMSDAAMTMPGIAATSDAPEQDSAAQAPAAPQAEPAPTRRAPIEPGRFAAAELRAEMASNAERASDAEAAPTAAAAMAAAAYIEAQDSRPESNEAVMNELRSLRGMINTQLAGLSFFDTVRRSPLQTRMLRLLIGNGFSPALARQLVARLPDQDEARGEQWLREALTRNLSCADDDAITVQGGVYALIGPTGVGKTTTTAKLAATFAARHGAGSVGLITVDTYRMAASEQLRAFGRILNIPVHVARDAASLRDLLQLFERKKLVLIDTVGIGQRDRRMHELFDALPSDRVKRLLLLNACAQAETLEEVAQNYGAKPGMRCVISKVDEAVKLGAVVDLVIRHRLRVEGIATGQRVPEDWHAPRAQLIVQKALMQPRASVFMPDDNELGLMLTTPSTAAQGMQLEPGHA